MRIEELDHLVLTVTDIDRTRAFYERVLGMETLVFGEGRHALTFGTQKLNLHEAGQECEPKAAVPPRAQPTSASSRTRRWPRSLNTWRPTASRSSKDP